MRFVQLHIWCSLLVSAFGAYLYSYNARPGRPPRPPPARGPPEGSATAPRRPRAATATPRRPTAAPIATRMKAKAMVVGHDFRFGRGREGTAEGLRDRLEL